MIWFILNIPPAYIWLFLIGVAPITQYTHVRNKSSNTQWSPPNVVSDFHTSLREVPILRRDEIEENPGMIQ